ncbi:MAG TPA: HAMP domain-containing sensor histidine kinase [Streptosporangiaceae bacterium]|nr:HAMP domain-containing sensor histidine kinase [Streptosporangiaceae bacterium]
MLLHSYPAALVARLPRRTVRLRLTALYGGLFLASGIGLLAITNILARSLPGPVFHTPATGPRPAYSAQPSHGAAPHTLTPPAGYVQQVAVQAAHQHAAALNQLLVVSAIALGIMAIASAVLGWLVAGRVLRPLREMTATARAISEDNLHQRLAVPGPGDELKDLGDTIDGLLDRLQAAFDAQRNFVASASHELRTPLTLARTLLQMALTDPQPTLASYRSTCQELLEASDQQEQLIEALLTLARSQRGLDHREILDLADITREVLGSREADVAAQGLAVRASISTAPVPGDERLLQRLVTNLIDNAIRHNIPGGEISIRITADGKHPSLTITNTGPVIPPGQVTRLLQPFQRLPATPRADAEGLGLGLSIAASIAKAHHATLTINPGPHGGLHIGISFPPATRTARTRQAALATA